jgi:hypothetical protein
MSTSTVAYYDFAASKRRRSAPKTTSRSFLASAAVTALVLGCAWTVYTNIFAASPYPQIGSAGPDAVVTRRWADVAVRSAPPLADDTRTAGLESRPLVSAPASVPSGPSLSFDDRFSAAARQGVASVAPADTLTLADVSLPIPAPKQAASAVATAKPKEISPPAPPVRTAAIAPAPRPAEPQPEKSPATTMRDMAQRAKAAVMSLASNERQTIVEKLWGRPQPQPRGPSLLSFASADANLTGSLGPTQNPALAGNTPRYDQSTAVYDISAHMVYLPDGTKLEAHSGLGPKLDDPSSANIRMRGVTPPHIYELMPREALFHGVPALRLTPVGGEEAIYGRSGLLAHSFMLGPNGDSNGCVSFRDYNAFLNAYRNLGIKRLAVVARVD